MLQMSRRQFLKVTATSLAGSSLALMGFAPDNALAEVRQYKLARTTETRNTCPYCSVGCGILMYGLGDGAKNATASIIHIEGDPDHPVNRGTLCPKGASLIDFIHSPNRLKYPEYRAAGSNGMLAASAGSNEVGYLTHKVARSMGLLAFDNQARV
jgi:formate dehydrogenase major subunit